MPECISGRCFLVSLCFPWERPYCTAPPCALRPCTRKMEVKLLHRLRRLCQLVVKPGRKICRFSLHGEKNCPKGLFRRWAERQKAPGTLSKNARGKRVCGSNRGKGRQGLGGCIAAILLDKEQRLADAVDDDLQHRRLTIPVSFLDFCIGEVQPQIFFLCGKGLTQQRVGDKESPGGDTCFSFASPTEAWNMSPYCPPCQLPPPAS